MRQPQIPELEPWLRELSKMAQMAVGQYDILALKISEAFGDIHYIYMNGIQLHLRFEAEAD